MFLDINFLKSEEVFLKLDHTVEGKDDWLPTYHFKICLPDGTEIGVCDLRVGHSEGVYYGGNIGYRVDEPYRGHHCAGKACLLLFRLAKKHGMEYLYITCSPENTASRRTCEYAGGVLEGVVDVPEDNDMYQRGERKKCVYRFAL